jgi:hypothetical protein
MLIPKSFIPYHPLTNFEIMDFMKINKIDGEVKMRNEPYTKNKIVINLDDKENTGTHWVLLFIKDNKMFYFDSFGIPPPEEVVNKKNDKRLFYSTNQIQPRNSILCGYFVCACLYWLNKGRDLYDFVDKFGMSNEQKNDKIIKDIFNNATVNDNCITEIPGVEGSGIDIVDEAGKLFEGQEWHLRSIMRNEDGDLTIKKHNWTGPFSDNEKKIDNWDELRKTPWTLIEMDDVILTDDKYKGINKVDQNAMMHDIAYDLIHRQYEKKDQLEQIHKADKILEDASIKIMRDSNESIFTRVEAGFVGLVMHLKRKIGLGGKKKDLVLNELLHFIKKHQSKLSEASQSILASLLSQD